MSRENFHRLLQRYLEGQCTPEEERLVDHWYQILEGQPTAKITIENFDAIEASIWEKIQGQIDEDIPSGTTLRLAKSSRLNNMRNWIIAASVAVFLMGSGTFYYFRVLCHPTTPHFVAHRMADSELINVHNPTSETKSIILPDESLVKLYPGAAIEYASSFDKIREVKLTGTAFFHVEANPENPFWVYHEGLVTKVVGTSFKIKAPTDQVSGEVIVYTGKVDVFYNGNSENVMRRILSAPKRSAITANKRAVIREEILEETLVPSPEPLAEEVKTMPYKPFTNTAIPHLAKKLSALYGLEIIADKNLSDVTFTGDISGLSLFKQLDIICTVTNTTYEVVGTSIFIKP